MKPGPERRWIAAAVAVLVGHAALLAALMNATAEPLSPPAATPPLIVVSLVEPPPPPPPVQVQAPDPAPEPSTTSAPAGPSPAPPDTATPRPPVPAAARPRRVIATPPPDVEPLPASPAPPGPPLPLLGGAQLAGATVAGPGSGGGDGSGAGGGGGSGAGGGSGGGRCDMVRRVQDRLRRTPSVRAAVSEAGRSMNASGRAILVWDGDWLQSRGQSGKGLAGVRQAIALEVAFAPAECRTQTMAGLAVMSLDDSPGGARLALGRGSWRWSDLLGAG